MSAQAFDDRAHRYRGAAADPARRRAIEAELLAGLSEPSPELGQARAELEAALAQARAARAAYDQARGLVARLERAVAQALDEAARDEAGRKLGPAREAVAGARRALNATAERARATARSLRQAEDAHLVTVGPEFARLVVQSREAFDAAHAVAEETAARHWVACVVADRLRAALFGEESERSTLDEIARLAAPPRQPAAVA